MKRSICSLSGAVVPAAVLGDEQDRQAAIAQPRDELKDLVDDLRREAQ
jgi:hypothetical protein